MNEDYKYWCFDNRLNDLVWRIFLSLEIGEEQTIDLSKHEDIAYAHEVSWKCTLLAEGLSALQVLQKMPKVSSFPLNIDNVKIDRHEWFRITHDLIHYRLSALRDYTFQLINSVLELKIPSIQLKFVTIKKKIDDDNELVTILSEIIEAEKDHRQNRNLLAHEGIYKDVYIDQIETNKFLSIAEGNLKSTNEGTLEEFVSNYESKSRDMLFEFIPEADKMDELLNKLGDYLSNIFFERYNSKKSEKSI